MERGDGRSGQVFTTVRSDAANRLPAGLAGPKACFHQNTGGHCCAFAGVVGGPDALVVEERPQPVARIVLRFAHAAQLRVGAEPTTRQQAVDHVAERSHHTLKSPAGDRAVAAAQPVAKPFSRRPQQVVAQTLDLVIRMLARRTKIPPPMCPLPRRPTDLPGHSAPAAVDHAGEGVGAEFVQDFGGWGTAKLATARRSPWGRQSVRMLGNRWQRSIPRCFLLRRRVAGLQADKPSTRQEHLADPLSPVKGGTDAEDVGNGAGGADLVWETRSVIKHKPGVAVQIPVRAQIKLIQDGASDLTVHVEGQVGRVIVQMRVARDDLEGSPAAARVAAVADQRVENFDLIE